MWLSPHCGEEIAGDGMKQCPICGRDYKAPPAISRIDGREICPVCGVVENLAGFADGEEIIEALEIKSGRVEPI